MMLDSDRPDLAGGAAALARKVADRIKKWLRSSAYAVTNSLRKRKLIEKGKKTMLRRTSILATIAIVIVVAIGAGARAQAAAQKACALLTADDVAAVLGDKVTWSSAQAGGSDDGTSCNYATKVLGDDAAHLTLAGGRADFDTNIQQLQDMSKQYHLPPLTALSGVGDMAYYTVGQGSSGPVPAQVFVMKGGIYFNVELFCQPAKCASLGAALARRVADRIKSK